MVLRKSMSRQYLSNASFGFHRHFHCGCLAKKYSLFYEMLRTSRKCTSGVVWQSYTRHAAILGIGTTYTQATVIA
jgi:hypothetical protein